MKVTTVSSCIRRYATVNSNLPQPLDLLVRYRGLVAAGQLKYDEEQVRVVMQLRRLQKELDGYAPRAILTHMFRPIPREPDASVEPWWSYSKHENEGHDFKALVKVRNHAESLAELDTPKGLLLTGSPGTGKSLLIDMWFSGLPTAYKTRKHYSTLVLEIYRGVWEETQRRMLETRPNAYIHPRAPWTHDVRSHWRELVRTGSLQSVWNADPAPTPSTQPTIAFIIAKRLILSHWLLVFDEMQLLDVSSAGLLADVLSWYWRLGGVVVGTSNKLPDDLYKNGVQRERLEPFVEALKVRCPVLTMRSETDWREIRGGDGIGRTWFNSGQEEEFTKSLNVKEEPSSNTLSVFGRPLHVPWVSGGTCKFAFKELCDQAGALLHSFSPQSDASQTLGPADYLTLSSHYHTIAITDIPILKIAAKNQARRFISLIDALYESRCRIICLAECDPKDLFFPGEGNNEPEEVDAIFAESIADTMDVSRPNTASYDTPSMKEERVVQPHQALDELSIFSGQEEQFAYKRALSRLIEMTSVSYGVEETWTPLPLHMRQWETPSEPFASHLSLMPLASSRDQGSENLTQDFAEEASYGSTTTRGRYNPLQLWPIAPTLKEDHVWGVRDDWGPGAKAWGQGTKVSRKASEEGKA